jgi:hypothetical protein
MCPGTCGNAFVPAVKDTQPIRKNIARNTSVLFDGKVTAPPDETKEDKEESQSFPRFELFDSQRESHLLLFSILFTLRPKNLHII